MTILERSPDPYRDYGNGILVHRLANIAGAVEVGPGTRIDAFVTITGKVRIGTRCHIGAYAALLGSAGIEMGDECSMSPGCRIFTGSFDRRTSHRANPQLPDKAYLEGPVRIGNRCIVGANSVVLPGVTLVDEVLIGALSLVNADLLQSGIHAGVPVILIHATAGVQHGTT